MCVVPNWVSFLHIQVQEEGERRESAQLLFLLVSNYSLYVVRRLLC